MINGSVTISRVSVGGGDDYIAISVRDEASKIKFLETKLTLEDFALCLTGQGSIPCDIKFRDLDHIGKQKETEKLIFEMPECSYDSRKTVAQGEALRHTPEGWTASTYYGSQDSFFAKDGKQFACTTIMRWV